MLHAQLQRLALLKWRITQIQHSTSAGNFFSLAIRHTFVEIEFDFDASRALWQLSLLVLFCKEGVLAVVNHYHTSSYTKTKRRWPLIDTFALHSLRGWSHDSWWYAQLLNLVQLSNPLVGKKNLIPPGCFSGAKAIWKSISANVWGQESKVCLPLGITTP